MNFADVLVLALLAAADICLVAYLRRRRARCIRIDRMTRSLQLHINRELAPETARARPRPRIPQRVG